MAARERPGRVMQTLLLALTGYIGLRLLPPAPLPWALAGAVGLAGLAALVNTALAPILGRRPARGAMAWASLLAMGYFSSLLVLTLLRDAGLLLVAGWNAWGTRPLGDWRAPSALAVPLLALAASAVGLVNARRRPPVRTVNVPITGLPAALDGFTIVQISDLHVGPTIRRPFVDGVVRAINRLQADVVVLTGDLVDGSVAELREHVAPLAQLTSRHGVFAVTGNHEYYAGVDQWLQEYRRLGARVLMNDHTVLQHDGAALLLAGVADYTAHHFDASHQSDPQQALRGAPAGAHPKLLLAHQPRTAAAAEAAGFDLQLSGHTHGGQFLPWRWFVPLQQPYTAGLHRLGRLWVYTSRGTGYWGPPKRLGAPSEITRLRLRAA
jgi:predicted MPP superfamily phosphohydrolase